MTDGQSQTETQLAAGLRLEKPIGFFCRVEHEGEPWTIQLGRHRINIDGVMRGRPEPYEIWAENSNACWRITDTIS